jgi:hypothetical protein
MAYFSLDAACTSFKTMRLTILLVLRVYCCGGNVSTEPLSTAIGGYTYRHTDWWQGFMKYAVDMG